MRKHKKKKKCVIETQETLMENCLMFIFFSFHSELYDGHEAILFHGMASL